MISHLGHLQEYNVNRNVETEFQAVLSNSNSTAAPPPEVPDDVDLTSVETETKNLGAALSDLPAMLPMARLLAERAYHTATSIAARATENCYNSNKILRKTTEDCREAMEKL